MVSYPGKKIPGFEKLGLVTVVARIDKPVTQGGPRNRCRWFLTDGEFIQMQRQRATYRFPTLHGYSEEEGRVEGGTYLILGVTDEDGSQVQAVLVTPLADVTEVANVIKVRMGQSK